MKQRLDEWINPNPQDLNYYDRQIINPYRSTIKFVDFLDEVVGLLDQKILDLGTGKGANMFYIKNRFPQTILTGLDINYDLVQKGNEYVNKNGITDIELRFGDMYALDQNLKNQYDGILSFQTLSWLPSYEEPLEQMMSLNPDWIGITSLFYDGLIDCKIEVSMYKNHEDCSPFKAFYNVLSLQKIQAFANKYGYQRFIAKPFELDIDIPKPMDKNIMGTYTLCTKDSERRIQISGPLLMSWYFLILSK